MSYFVCPGSQVGRLTIIENIGYMTQGCNPYHIFYKCVCSCGKEVLVRKDHLSSGATKSCGCLQNELVKKRATTHGHTVAKHPSKTYAIWCTMKTRCTNPSSKNYPTYGGRGIKVCERWLHSFENFLENMGEKPNGLTLERMNNNGDYTPENCKWATRKEQCNNTRRNRFILFNGRSQTLAQWAEEIGISSPTLCKRLKRGWPVAQALTA